MKEVKIGVIGGSGVYEIDGAKVCASLDVSTPFGKPSDKIKICSVEGRDVAFLPRHGIGHRILPQEVNYRANIFALKKLGVKKIIAVSACGSLKNEIKPRDFVIPDQLFDRTKCRPSTFFGDGIVAHVGFAEPFCPALRKILVSSARKLKLPVHNGGTYVCMEGPQFSTKSESKVYRSLGFSIVGMTNIPESKLAREAEICYATIALATDYDVWKENEEVSVEKVVANMKFLTSNVKLLLKAAIKEISFDTDCVCESALKNAIQTEPSAINKKTARKLGILLKKYI
ncbi:MAG: S-methyl-5'-thioadenosine phosphorylase [Elusimicrobia bacterium ADurb.Bin231]|nr:MAG: S-methyl-5'-thioadenosine phosphorylase [Elusimicrobia bacterium ADurb.Bin231]